MSTHSNTLYISDARKTVLARVGVGAPGPAIIFNAYGWRRPTRSAPLLGFNGQRAESMTDAYHLGHGHRVYSPVLMRFQAADQLSPFGKGGLNGYAYCVGDPINFADPTGRYVAAIVAALANMADDVRHYLYRFAHASRSDILSGFAAGMGAAAAVSYDVMVMGRFVNLPSAITSFAERSAGNLFMSSLTMVAINTAADATVAAGRYIWRTYDDVQRGVIRGPRVYGRDVLIDIEGALGSNHSPAQSRNQIRQPNPTN
jgi:RHS repeat-associated protein